MNNSFPNKENNYGSRQYPVISKQPESMSRQIGNEEPDGQERYRESNHTADCKQGHTVLCKYLRICFVYVPGTFDRSSQHGGNRQEKRKFSSRPAVKLLL